MDPSEIFRIAIDDDLDFLEAYKLFTESVGILIQSHYIKNETFSIINCYPIGISKDVSTFEIPRVYQYSSGDRYVAVIEDPSIGIPIIFDIINNVELMKNLKDDYLMKYSSSRISGLSNYGMVMLPLKKEPGDIKKSTIISDKRKKLITSARNGDERAIESLTIKDIDKNEAVSRKVQNEDIYTIVDSYFMPDIDGLECNRYAILGDIENVSCQENSITKEKIYSLLVRVNDVPINVFINSEDLLGEPVEGRRFKGDVFLQGYINF